MFFDRNARHIIDHLGSQDSVCCTISFHFTMSEFKINIQAHYILNAIHFSTDSKYEIKLHFHYELVITYNYSRHYIIYNINVLI